MRLKAEKIPDIWIETIGYGCSSVGYTVIPHPYAVSIANCAPPSCAIYAEQMEIKVVRKLRQARDKQSIVQLISKPL